MFWPGTWCTRGAHHDRKADDGRIFALPEHQGPGGLRVSSIFLFSHPPSVRSRGITRFPHNSASVLRYVDVGSRFKGGDLENVFDGSKLLVPKPSDLSYYNWEVTSLALKLRKESIT